MPRFRLDGSKLLCVDIDGESFRALNGSMVAYEGRVEFKKEGMKAKGGFMGAIKAKATGESLALMECKGSGTVYVANDANEITVLQLQGEELFVEASNLVALESGLQTDQKFNGLRGATTGQGLFTTTVKGTGQAAITSDGPAIVLDVSLSHPLVVDPQAYVAHTGGLQQDFVTDVSWKTALVGSSGEAFQLRFTGQGTVWIQPAERVGGIDV